MSTRADRPLFLGVDGGGTSTAAWLGDDSGAVLGRGAAGASNAKAVGADAARAALLGAIRSAFADAGLEPGPAAVACLGLAGFDRPDDRQLLRDWADSDGLADRLVLVNDGELVLAAGTPEGFGVGVISGTGSIAVAKAPDGRSGRAGGWGYILGDEGSAHDVALAALRLVARRCDGREPRPGRDALTDRMIGAVGVSAPSALISAIYSGGYDRTRIAGLAPAVLAAADDDPEVVPRILDPAGSELALTALAAARSVGWSDTTLPLAMAGGFLLAAAPVSRALVAHLEREGGYTAIVGRVPDPVLGALILARRSVTS